ncbi:MAG TPA: DedA family protein [Casimicrobiaceae bacterium]|nr:DedA family protein [Casimicrobiaceae bacterium]
MELGALFEDYGLLLVFGSVLLEQMGPPIPSGPLLIVAGALANEARASALPIAGVAWGAGMLGKIVLYAVGGRYGRQAMNTLCRLSVTPNSSIGKTDRHFERWGAALLILAEFIPGVRTLAPSVAGAEKLSPTPFLLYSALGAALWTALYLGIGLVFSKELDRILAIVERSGRVAIGVIAVAVAVYFALRWWRRHRSLNA